jgi:hypothetical protein
VGAITDSILNTQMTTLQNHVTAWNGALIALSAANGVKSYTVDTGQSVQTVTRNEINKINDVIQSLLNQIAVIETRLTGCGSTYVNPGW